MSKENLTKMFQQADAIDLREGLTSYERYHRVMLELAQMYSVPIERVIAAFVALSPNNDYSGNLRSLVTCLHGYKNQWPTDQIIVSTYRHCRNRAMQYITGQVDFISQAKGLKIRNFYFNVLTPDDNRYVTIDGHMVAAFRGLPLTMKEAILRSKKEYVEIADTVKQLAFSEFIRPNQYQAVIWFTRKRVFNIKAELHADMFLPADDVWKTYRDVSLIKPYQQSEAERWTKPGNRKATKMHSDQTTLIV